MDIVRFDLGGLHDSTPDISTHMGGRFLLHLVNDAGAYGLGMDRICPDDTGANSIGTDVARIKDCLAGTGRCAPLGHGRLIESSLLPIA